MRVQLAYGEQGLTVDLPDDRTTVVEPRYVPGAADPAAVLRSALREPVAGPPLREIVRPGQKVAISVCDGTRAQPRDLMVPAVLAELDGIVDRDDVVTLTAEDEDGGSGVEQMLYRIDGGTVRNYTGPFDFDLDGARDDGFERFEEGPVREQLTEALLSRLARILD